MKRSRLFTKLRLHLFMLGTALALDVLLGVGSALAWRAVGSDRSSAFMGQELRYAQLQAQMRHLKDLPAKVQQADADAQTFYAARIAPNYSTMLEQLGGIAEKDHVRLSRAAYAQDMVIGSLQELRIDAGLSGQYSDLMHFINDVERDRDHVFSIVDGLTFTGEQDGRVNLRLRITTYLSADAADLPPQSPVGEAPR